MCSFRLQAVLRIELYINFPVWLFVIFVFFVMLGTVNGTNFTDGLDGLLSSVTVLVAAFFTVVAVATKSGLHPVTGAVVGALLGLFLSIFIRQRFLWAIQARWRSEVLWQVRQLF